MFMCVCVVGAARTQLYTATSLVSKNSASEQEVPFNIWLQPFMKHMITFNTISLVWTDVGSLLPPVARFLFYPAQSRVFLCSTAPSARKSLRRTHRQYLSLAALLTNPNPALHQPCQSVALVLFPLTSEIDSNIIR